MADRPSPRVVVGIVLGVLALMALVSWLPFVIRDRDDLLATPGPQPSTKITLVGLPTGKSVCVNDVSLSPGLRTLRIRVLVPKGQTGGPIDVALLDARNRQIGNARFEGGYTLPATITAPVTLSIHKSVIGSACLFNHGPPMAASGTDEQRTRTRSETIVDQSQVVGDLTLELLGRHGPLSSRLGELFTRAATFKPVTSWEIGVLAILLLLAIPGGLALALNRAARDAPDPDEARLRRPAASTPREGPPAEPGP